MVKCMDIKGTDQQFVGVSGRGWDGLGWIVLKGLG